MKNPLVSLGIMGEKTPTPILLHQDIKYSRSVIHASIQASGRAINEALGISDDTLLDEFLATDAGKRWAEGFRQYAIHVLSKTV